MDNRQNVEGIEINKNRQDELLQEHLTSKAVEETCLPLMKNDWADTGFRTDMTISSNNSVLI